MTYAVFLREMLAIEQNLSLTDQQLKDRKRIIKTTQHYMDGHINETMEHRNFYWWVQQLGKLFNDFLFTITELVNTCNYCSDTCVQKSIHNQLVEGFIDGATIEDLL